MGLMTQTKPARRLPSSISLNYFFKTLNPIQTCSILMNQAQLMTYSSKYSLKRKKKTLKRKKKV